MGSLVSTFHDTVTYDVVPECPCVHAQESAEEDSEEEMEEEEEEAFSVSYDEVSHRH